MPTPEYSVHAPRYFAAAHYVSVLFFFLMSAYVLYVLNFQLPDVRAVHDDVLLPPRNDDVRSFVHIFLIAWTAVFLIAAGVLIYLESTSFLTRWNRGFIVLMLFAVALGAALTNPVGSSDFFQYLAYGWILVEHNVNPYIVTPKVFAYDPIVSSLVSFWWDVPCNYGPVALLSFAIPALFGATNVAAMSIILKLIWFVCYLVVATLFYALLLRLQKPCPVSMTVLLFLNPFALWFWLIDGHMDILPVMFFFAAMLFLVARKWILAGIFTALFCASKILFIIIIPFLLLFVFKEAAKSRNLKAVLIQYLASIFIVLGIFYVPFKGAELVNVFSDFLDLPMRRLPGFLSPVPGFFYHLLGVLKIVEPRNLFDVSSLLGMWVFGGIYIYMLVRSLRHEISIDNLLMTSGITLFWFTCSVSYSQPWYVMWFYPILFASLRNARALLLVSAILCFFSVAGVFSHPVDAQKLVAQIVALVAVFMLLVKSRTLLAGNSAEN